MYLAELFVENFRGFGAEKDKAHLALKLAPGLNVLVGENDAGKSSIVDAIRFVLSTRTQDSRLTEHDFHAKGAVRAETLTIRCTFRDLSQDEVSRFLEWLTIEESTPCLVVTLQASRRDPTPGRPRRMAMTLRSGRRVDGPTLDGEIRSFLQATYLRPLRDAEAELAAGRGSRLSQILEAHPDFQTHNHDDSMDPSVEPTTVLGIMRRAERKVRDSVLVKSTAQSLNADYLKHVSLGELPLSAEIGIARDVELRQILEKLDLWLAPEIAGDPRTRRGLGYNNLLFMAAELLLLGTDGGISLLLIEEPEAHLHPQLQMRLMDFLDQNVGMRGVAKGTTPRGPLQVILTTHSPNLASKADLQGLIVMSNKTCYRLAKDETRLAPSDYDFLRRFLDVTKANLFFARGVVIVEGDAETLLLPAIATKLGRPFAKYGVSIVSVGSRGLFRYSRIFQRKNKEERLPIRVACIADLDLVPETATYVVRRKRAATSQAEVGAAGTGEEGQRELARDEARDAEKAPVQSSAEVPSESEDDLTGRNDDREARATALRMNDDDVVKTFVSPQWTLEHDLAACNLGREMHVAIQMAKVRRAQDRKGTVLSEEHHRKVQTQASTDYEELQAKLEGDVDRIAAAVYEPLYKKQASKVCSRQPPS